MTSISAGHIILTPTQPVGSGRPQRGSNPGPPDQESRALPTELPRPPPLHEGETLGLKKAFWTAVSDKPHGFEQDVSPVRKMYASDLGRLPHPPASVGVPVLWEKRKTIKLESNISSSLRSVRFVEVIIKSCASAMCVILFVQHSYEGDKTLTFLFIIKIQKTTNIIQKIV